MIDVKKFVAAREKAGLSQADLARRSGVTQQAIGEIEAGRSKTSRSIFKLAAAMFVPANELDDAIPALDGDLEEILVQIKSLPAAQAALVKSALRDVIQIARGPGEEEG